MLSKADKRCGMCFLDGVISILFGEWERQKNFFPFCFLHCISFLALLRKNIMKLIRILRDSDLLYDIAVLFNQIGNCAPSDIERCSSDIAILKGYFFLADADRFLSHFRCMFTKIQLVQIADCSFALNEIRLDHESDKMIVRLLSVELPSVEIAGIADKCFTFVETLRAGLPGKPQKTLFIRLIAFRCSLDDPFVDLKIILVEGGVLFYDLSECFIQVNLCVFLHCITPFPSL